ncbi:MAG: hypothetical protein JST16_05980 [Bdellovibrionales bacterium]|nr:hypothetical protein [Bdellovibrionales bacterium]
MKMGWVRNLAWGLALSAGVAQAFGGKGFAWTSELMAPCDCNTNLREAIPYAFANRLEGANTNDMIRVETDLIEGFTNDTTVANSKKVILWTVMELGHYELLNALKGALAAGVEVRLVLDGKYVVAPPPADVPGDEELAPAKDGAPAKQPKGPSRSLRFAMDIAAQLQAAGATVSYSDPDWAHSHVQFPRLMHEKVRIFGIKARRKVTPFFAYVSTHNDSYSDTQGDVLPSVPDAKVQAGHLQPEDFVKGANGNVQTSFILRDAKLLANLLQNYLDEEKVYGQGTGSIADVPRQEPELETLADGSTIQLAYTYGAKDGPNPNQAIADFLQGFASSLKKGPRLNTAYLQEFVFAFAPVNEALAAAANHSAVSLNALVDWHYVTQEDSDIRAMAGLYTIRGGQKNARVDQPWSDDLLSRVSAKTFVDGHDLLHTKNSSFTYTDARGIARRRVYTGSLNLSQNGASNKEVSFEIDSAQSHDLFAVMDAQRQALEHAPQIFSVVDQALLGRMAALVNHSGAHLALTPDVRTAYAAFVQRALDPRTQSEWLTALSDFYAATGVKDEVVQLVMTELRKNLAAAPKFRPTMANLEVMCLLSTNPKSLAPAERQAILNLFQ